MKKTPSRAEYPQSPSKKIWDRASSPQSRRRSSAAPPTPSSSISEELRTETILAKSKQTEESGNARAQWAKNIENKARDAKSRKEAVLSSFGRVEEMVEKLGDQENADLYELLDISEINHFLVSSTSGKQINAKGVTDSSKTKIDKYTNDLAQKATLRGDILHSLNVWFSEREDDSGPIEPVKVPHMEAPTNAFVIREIEKVLQNTQNRMMDIFRGFQKFKERSDAIFLEVAEKEWLTPEVQDDYQHLRTTAKKFSMEAASLAAKLQQANNVVESLRIQMEELDAEKREVDARLSHYRKDNVDFEKRMAELRDRLSETETRNAKLQFQLEAQTRKTQEVVANLNQTMSTFNRKEHLEKVQQKTVGEMQWENDKLRKVIKCLKKQLTASERSRMETEGTIGKLFNDEHGVLVMVPSFDYVRRLERKAHMAQTELDEILKGSGGSGQRRSSESKTELIALHQVALDRLKDEYECKMAELMGGNILSTNVDVSDITKRMVQRVRESEKEIEELKEKLKTRGSSGNSFKLALEKLNTFYHILNETYIPPNAGIEPSTHGSQGDHSTTALATESSGKMFVGLNQKDGEFMDRFAHQVSQKAAQLFPKLISPSSPQILQSEYEKLLASKWKSGAESGAEAEAANSAPSGGSGTSGVGVGVPTAKTPNYPEFFDETLFEDMVKQCFEHLHKTIETEEEEGQPLGTEGQFDSALSKLFVFFKMYKDSLAVYYKYKYSHSRNAPTRELAALLQRDGQLKEAKTVATFQSLVAKKRMKHARDTIEAHHFEPTSIAYQFLERMEAHYKVVHEKWAQKRQFVMEERRKNLESVVVL